MGTTLDPEKLMLQLSRSEAHVLERSLEASIEYHNRLYARGRSTSGALKNFNIALKVHKRLRILLDLPTSTIIEIEG